MMRLAESTANTASPFLEILSSVSSKTRIGRLLDFPLPMVCGPRATDDDAFASIDASVSAESRVESCEVKSGRPAAPLTTHNLRPSNQILAIGEDHRGELGVDVELMEEVLDVVADGDGRDEESLADPARGHPLGKAAEDFLFARGQGHRLTLLRRHRPEGLRGRNSVFLQPALEGRRLLVLRTHDVNDRRKRGMVGGDREEGDFEPLPGLADLDREGEALHRLLGLFSRLVSDRTVAVAVDVSVRVAAAHDVVAALSEHAPRGLAEQLFALLVPEDDLVGGINGENSFAAAGDFVEGFRRMRHENPACTVSPTGLFRPARRPFDCRKPDPGAPSARFSAAGGANDGYRAPRHVDQAKGDTPDDPLIQRVPSLASDYDQVRLDAVGLAGDRFRDGRPAVGRHKAKPRLQAAALEGFRRIVQDFLRGAFLERLLEGGAEIGDRFVESGGGRSVSRLADREDHELAAGVPRGEAGGELLRGCGPAAA